jgi:hypothetical protein
LVLRVGVRFCSESIPTPILIPLYLLLFWLTGTSSSLEVASCVPQIFGNDDIDVLSWDFGMYGN